MLPVDRSPNDSFSRRTASDVLSIRSSGSHYSLGHGRSNDSRWGPGPFDAEEETEGVVAQRPAAMSRTCSARIATEPLKLVLSDLRRPAHHQVGFGPSPGSTPSPSPSIPEGVSASPFSQATDSGDADMMDASYESSIIPAAESSSQQLFTGEEICGESAERWRVLGRCWKDHLSHCKGGPKDRLCRGAPASGFA